MPIMWITAHPKPEVGVETYFNALRKIVTDQRLMFQLMKRYPQCEFACEAPETQLEEFRTTIRKALELVSSSVTFSVEPNRIV